MVFPVVARSTRLRLRQRWARKLLAMLDVRVSPLGSMPDTACLIVANHVSWLDIYVLSALCPTGFVAKDEVRRWPVIGWLAYRNDTIFLNRDRRGAAHVMARQIADYLEQGRVVTVFPEGTTTEGDQVLPFHAALLEAGVLACVPVQPVALRYRTRDGHPSRAPAYCGDTTLLQSFWAVCREPGLVAEIVILPQLASTGRTRHALARDAHAAIASALGVDAVHRRPVPERIGNEAPLH